MKYLHVFITVALFFIGGSQAASALSCAQPPENLLARGNVIFLGTVTSLSVASSTPDDGIDYYASQTGRGDYAVLSVEKYWKGEEGKSVRVTNIYPWGGGNNSFFQVGKKYIVFGQKSTGGERGVVSAGIDCGSTAVASDGVAADLDALVAGSIKVPTTPSTAVPFSRNLSVGMSGSDVATLQSFLEKKGFLVMPLGVAKGYFGKLTQRATAAYQEAKGIAPAYGFFGPLTRAAAVSEYF